MGVVRGTPAPVLLHVASHIQVPRRHRGGLAGRQEKQVQAEKCMDNMSGAHAVEVGIAGDYSEACMRFIRLWDKPDKDPATSAKDIAEFRHLT